MLGRSRDHFWDSGVQICDFHRLRWDQTGFAQSLLSFDCRSSCLFCPDDFYPKRLMGWRSLIDVMVSHLHSAWKMWETESLVIEF